MKYLRTFPAGSSGRPHGLTVQHLSDILTEQTDETLLNKVTDFVIIILDGELPLPARDIFSGGRLIALEKKHDKGKGVRPIAFGYTLCHLIAKCANSQSLKDEAKNIQELQPVQVVGDRNKSNHITMNKQNSRKYYSVRFDSSDIFSFHK